MLLLMFDMDRMFIGKLKRIFFNIDKSVNIISFEDDVALVDYLIENHGKADGVIISTDFENGLDFAVQIGEIYPKLPIIISSMRPAKICEKIFLDYDKFSPFALISKPVEKNSIIKIYQKLVSKGSFCKTVSFTVNGKNREISTDDIIYIESDKRQLIIHTANEKLLTYGKISTFKENLPQYFLRPHASFLVNMKYIFSLDRTSIKLVSDVKIPISRGQKVEFLSLYRSFQGLNLDYDQ